MTEKSIRTAKPNYLIRHLKQHLKNLREAYKLALTNNELGIYEWLRDNYYLLEREGRYTIKELKNIGSLTCDEKGLPLIFLLCLDIAEQPIDELESTIYNSLSVYEHYLSIKELQSLILMLKSAFIYYACNAVLHKEVDVSMISNAVNGFRALPDIDLESIVEHFSKVEQIFINDPAQIYSKMDKQSQIIYRNKCATNAEIAKIDELNYAQNILNLSENGKTLKEKHIGNYLFTTSEKNIYKKKGIISLLARAILPLIICIIISIPLNIWWAIPIIYFPIYEGLKPIIDFFSSKAVKPNYLPRMNLEGEIPKGAETLIVISTIVPSSDKAKLVAEKYEKLYQTNGNGAIKFCILADLKQAEVINKPEDSVNITALKKEIDRLNKRCDNKFILAVRGRSHIKTQQAYAGYERKRGAILELCNYIKGKKTTFNIIEGDKEFLRKVKFLIALDSDTHLLMNTAYAMVGTALHPLNKAVIDRKTRTVSEGYGILVPKITTDLASATSTIFSKIMTGAGGISVYDTLSGEYYQDFFDKTIFSGKGLIDVDAFETCISDALPDERVLSHDILEGGFLRTGFLSDVEVTDSCPKNYLSFLSRLHRWVRGDWQNSVWLAKNVPTKHGTAPNKFDNLTKYMILDNLRRSITPFFVVLCLILSIFFQPRWAFITIAMLSVAMPSLFYSISATINGGWQMLSRKYYSHVMPVAITSLLQSIFFVCVSIQNAFTNTDAIVRALYRQFVSRKKLLEWTTAADSDIQNKNNIFVVIKKCVPSILLGIILIFSNSSTVRVMGLLIVICPIVIWYTGRPIKHRSFALPYNSREKLRSYAASMWKYYQELCTPYDNYLPPDNIQESPVHVVAHRTSPTNIGLMMLSTLAAKDFEFIDSETFLIKIEQVLDTVEKMEKWNGNLLNWYDTHTLKPLSPRYVSVVDSGNFCCCLVALNEGLIEMESADIRVKSLISRIEKIVDQTDLTCMYNKRRKLFHIGYDVEEDKLTNSYYDLLMSESRMTSYFAIATRRVDSKHWGTLGRTLAREGGYVGPMSWTGTMFEYFMPHILLPIIEDSLVYEALQFCVLCQRRRARERKTVFGCSESGFYAFDPNFNYRYKAHGVQKLGLKRRLNSEYVVSPYSSFMALELIPQSALKNLNAMQSLNMVGRYGFYEAIDFTSERVGRNGYSIVKSYMAHHIGMSLLSIHNVLTFQKMQKRFMNNNQMAGAKELLEEKIPANASVFKDVEEREVPDKYVRTSHTSEDYEIISPVQPRMHVMANGHWSLCITDSGSSISISSGKDIVRRTTDLLRRPSGFFVFVQNNGERFSVTKAPDYSDKYNRTVKFNETSAIFSACNESVRVDMLAGIHPSMSCEYRKIAIENKRSEKTAADIFIYFEPCIAKYEDDSAHPAFSKLFIKCEYDNTLNAIIFYRREKEHDTPLYLVCGFNENVEFKYDFNREDVLQRGLGLKTFLQKEVTLKCGNGVPDPCAALKFSVELSGKEIKSYNFLMLTASTKEEAINNFLLNRSKGAISSQKLGGSPFFSSGLENRISSIILPQIFFAGRERKQRLEATRSNKRDLNAIWELGVSGDYPIVVCEINSYAEALMVEAYIKIISKLRNYGILFDLVILYSEGGEYNRPINNELLDMILKYSTEEIIGIKGGIHLIDTVICDETCITAVKALSTLIAPIQMARELNDINKYDLIEIKRVNKSDREIDAKNRGYGVYGGRFYDDRFEIDGTPLLPWCQVLANSEFGTQLSDSALGFTFANNSRENKLTPWFNDTISDNNGEMIILKVNGKYYDIVAGSSVYYTKNSAVYQSSLDDLIITLTVNVAANVSVKRMRVEISTKSAAKYNIELAYYTEPVLGINRKYSRQLVSKWESGMLILSNPFNTASPGSMIVTAGADDVFGADSCTCDRSDFFTGKWDDHKLAPLANVCATVFAKRTVAHKQNVLVDFYLGFITKKQTPKDLLSADFENYESENSIKIETGDKSVNFMVNTWLPSQIEQSRIYGRTGFYQCGGAYGFRDQLQDVCAMLYWNPSYTRMHILNCCKHQFIEGDVLHWWHPLASGDAGVRTKCSDDLLWLPYTVCQYVEKTADIGILDETVEYLSAEELASSENERYFIPKKSRIKASVYEHCIKAIKRVKFGSHGLPLIGNGDWNDGFSKVGVQGKGESVWLAMFLSQVCDKMAVIALNCADTETTQELLATAKKMKEAIDEHAYNGDWYMRAFYDDGTAMGVKGDTSCEIDLLPQSFATIVNLPDDDRKNKALDNAIDYLIDSEHKIIKLFSPPFENGKDPGYIKAYPPGVRENGGQYTHSAIWLITALFKAGRADEAYNLLKMINPAYRCSDEKTAKQYKVEPYAMAADVYSVEDVAGRGGWTLYTGAAGWFYRAIISEMLGIKLRGSHLNIEPNLPTSMRGYKATMQFKNTKIYLDVKYGEEKGLFCDEEKVNSITLDGREHNVVYNL